MSKESYNDRRFISGQKFAMLELKVTLAALVRRFKILPGNGEPQPCGDLILKSQNGLQVKLFPRN